MGSDDLIRLLTSLAMAADVVEAIENPALQARRGWNLAGWGYDWVPWGVRFLQRDVQARVTAAVVAVALPEERRAALPPSWVRAPWPTRLLLLG
jgi:hypothetical protein